MLSLLVEIYIFLIFAYVILSWMPEVRYQSWYRTLGTLTEPYLGLFRRVIPSTGFIDFSPMVGILLLILVEQALRRSGL